jgi:RND family efflux transporter MFP subunit
VVKPYNVTAQQAFWAASCLRVYTDNPMNLRSLGFLVVVLTLQAPVLAYAQDDAVTVSVDPVTIEPVSETAAVIGRFLSRQAGPVAAQSEGAVADVLVEVGDRVETGQIMVQLVIDRLSLNAELQRAEVRSAEAQLGVARAQKTLAEQELDRMSSLSESAAFSQARFEDSQQMVAIADAGVAAARAELLSAEATLAIVEDELSDAAILAPYDGVVVLRHTEVGSYVNVGDPVVSLLNDAWIEIEADVPSTRVGGLLEGTAIAITLDNGLQAEAFVRAVGVPEDPQARTRPVRFTPAWDVAPGELAEGQSVTLMIPSGPQTDVITVHKDAVVRSGSQSFVFVVAEVDMAAGTGFAQERLVQLGGAIGNRFIVINGLAAGELTVVRGNEGLGDGTPLRFTP